MRREKQGKRMLPKSSGLGNSRAETNRALTRAFLDGFEAEVSRQLGKPWQWIGSERDPALLAGVEAVRDAIAERHKAQWSELVDQANDFRIERIGDPGNGLCVLLGVGDQDLEDLRAVLIEQGFVDLADMHATIRAFVTHLSTPLAAVMALNDGRFIGTRRLAYWIRTAAAGLDEQDRRMAFARIFGSDSLRLAEALFKHGPRLWPDEEPKVFGVDCTVESGPNAEIIARLEELGEAVHRRSGEWWTAASE